MIDTFANRVKVLGISFSYGNITCLCDCVLTVRPIYLGRTRQKLWLNSRALRKILNIKLY